MAFHNIHSSRDRPARPTATAIRTRAVGNRCLVDEDGTRIASGRRAERQLPSRAVPSKVERMFERSLAERLARETLDWIRERYPHGHLEFELPEECRGPGTTPTLPFPPDRENSSGFWPCRAVSRSPDTLSAILQVLPSLSRRANVRLILVSRDCLKRGRTKEMKGTLLLKVGAALALMSALLASCTGRPTSTTSLTETSKPPVTSVSPTTPAVSFPPGSDLDFEVLVKSSGTTYRYTGESAQIQVMTSSGSLPAQTLDWMEEHDRPAVLNANYQGNFVILVFNGYRGNIYSELEVRRVWQDGSTIYVLAHFNDFVPKVTSLPAYSSQYEALKIRKSQLGQLGEYTFRLLDESGKERASTSAEISP